MYAGRLFLFMLYFFSPGVAPVPDHAQGQGLVTAGKRTPIRAVVTATLCRHLHLSLTKSAAKQISPGVYRDS